MRFVSTTLAAAAALTALSAQAEGLYVGGSVGASRYSDDFVSALTDRSGTGLKLYGGYALNPNFSVEAGVARLGKIRSAGSEFRGAGLFVDVVGIWPLANNFSLLGRAGVFNGMLDSTLAGDDRGTSVKFGAGVQYAIDKNISVRGEWERYRFDALGVKPNADLYSIGVNYRF
ncbi:MAG: outer membrane beta-barrel protein [Burkholderiaceae bacterium]|nr:outer membrane beta-barrel protein [Burkholderiaceae bacterium]